MASRSEAAAAAAAVAVACRLLEDLEGEVLGPHFTCAGGQHELKQNTVAKGEGGNYHDAVAARHCAAISGRHAG
jgi:hypothetical protein